MSTFKYKIHGNTYEVTVDRVQGNQVAVTVNGSTFDVEIERGEPGVPKITRLKSVPGAAPQPERLKPQGILGDVKSPLPGVVRGIPVKVGDMVKAGQTVIVIEAMKMENELGAPFAGKVTEIRVQSGQQVLEGDLLVRIGD